MLLDGPLLAITKSQRMEGTGSFGDLGIWLMSTV